MKENCAECRHHDVFWERTGCNLLNNGERCKFEPLAEKFCKSCPEPEYTLDDGRKLRLHECDFKDGVCPHGGDIVWWLQQPAEEGAE